MIPKTYLLCSPNDADPLGKGMDWLDLMVGLRKINSQITMIMPNNYPHWYPGKASGQTCLWLGPPPNENGETRGSLKICAFHLWERKSGRIPEWTQIGPKGELIARGWRAIFERIIAVKAATRRQLEHTFKVDLGIGGTDGLCARCRRAGVKERSTSASGLCDMHENVRKQALAYQDQRNEATYLARRI